MKYIKSYKKFVNEKLGASTLYNAADKFLKLGHHRKSKDILDNISLDESEFEIDLVAYEYKYLKNMHFPESLYELDKLYGSLEYFKDKDNKNKAALIKNARIISCFIEHDKLVLLLTDNEEEKIFKYDLKIDTINSENGKKLVFKGDTSGNATSLAFRKDIIILSKFIQKEYYNSKVDSGVKGLINRKANVSEYENLIELIPSMFTDYKRTFYTDENINSLKSGETIDKFKL